MKSSSVSSIANYGMPHFIISNSNDVINVGNGNSLDYSSLKKVISLITKFKVGWKVLQWARFQIIMKFGNEMTTGETVIYLIAHYWKK